MTTPGNRITCRILEFVLLAGLILAVPLLARLDVQVFVHGHSEFSLTEFAQEALLLLSALLFGAAAVRERDSRAWLVLVAGFFAVMLIRELDMWLDRIVHGFWIYPASLVALLSIAYAARNRSGLGDAMRRCTSGQSHAYIVAGLLVLLVFSRLYGSGTLWREVMGPVYTNGYRSFFQEGTELLGYVLLAFGSARFVFLERRNTEPGD